MIVSGGAVESARLLLNTKHSLFPDGLGNRYGWVGPQPAVAPLFRRHRAFRI